MTAVAVTEIICVTIIILAWMKKRSKGEMKMKKVNKLLHLVFWFSAGFLAGTFIRLGFEIINGRPAAIGGEALILPLVILLIWFGAQLGTICRDFKEYQRGYDEGYVDGQEAGTIEIRPIKIEVLDADYRQIP